MRARACATGTTTPEHMPSAHRRYAEWTPDRMVSEAAKLGPATVALLEAIMKAKPHPEQGFRSCLGIISLVKSYGPARVEAACRRGNNIGATTYGSIASNLKPASTELMRSMMSSLLKGSRGCLMRVGSTTQP